MSCYTFVRRGTLPWQRCCLDSVAKTVTSFPKSRTQISTLISWSIHDWLKTLWQRCRWKLKALPVWLLLARSPVFSHLSSTLHGLSTIRAFKVQQTFQQMFDEFQDIHSGKRDTFETKAQGLEVNMHFTVCVHWQRPGSYSWPLLAGLLCVLMGFAPFLSPPQLLPASTSGTVQNGLFFFFSSAHVTQLTRETRLMTLRWLWKGTSVVCDIAELEPGSVGLALSYAMTLIGMFQWGVRQSAEIENMVRLYTLHALVFGDRKCPVKRLVYQ